MAWVRQRFRSRATRQTSRSRTAGWRGRSSPASALPCSATSISASSTAISTRGTIKRRLRRRRRLRGDYPSQVPLAQHSGEPDPQLQRGRGSAAAAASAAASAASAAASGDADLPGRLGDPGDGRLPGPAAAAAAARTGARARLVSCKYRVAKIGGGRETFRRFSFARGVRRRDDPQRALPDAVVERRRRRAATSPSSETARWPSAADDPQALDPVDPHHVVVPAALRATRGRWRRSARGGSSCACTSTHRLTVLETLAPARRAEVGR